MRFSDKRAKFLVNLVRHSSAVSDLFFLHPMRSSYKLRILVNPKFSMRSSLFIRLSTLTVVIEKLRKNGLV